MAKKNKKKMSKLEIERLKNRTAFYVMITALSAPIAGIIDIIKMLLKHFLK